MKSFAKLILILLIPLAWAMGYSLMAEEVEIGSLTLSKADLTDVKKLLPSAWVLSSNVSELQEQVLEEQVLSDTIEAPFDPEFFFTSSVLQKIENLKLQGDSCLDDSSKLKIMFFGDSMLEWTSKRLCDYAMENGYDLSSVLWYSSSTKLWAETDTLLYFLNKVNPDYVLICLGSNELFVRDLSKRDKYIGTIIERLGGRPFVWISPPNWKPDSGINELIIKHVGMDRYFDSRSLELKRASDNVHPNKAAAAQWIDTIANWLQSPACRLPLPMNRPEETRKRKYHQYVLTPVS